jgi:tetratricopeptide (TPR) repeat protein
MMKLLTTTLRLLKKKMMTLHFSQTVSETHFNHQLGAACFFELEKFDECILDCDRAIELNKDFSKAYLRKAIALREKLDLVGALDVLKAGLTVEPGNESMTKEFNEI